MSQTTHRRLGGRGETELCEVLDRVLHKGVVMRAEVVITVADIDLLYLDARLFLSSIDTALERGALCASRSTEAIGRTHDPPYEHE